MHRLDDLIYTSVKHCLHSIDVKLLDSASQDLKTPAKCGSAGLGQAHTENPSFFHIHDNDLLLMMDFYMRIIS